MKKRTWLLCASIVLGVASCGTMAQGGGSHEPSPYGPTTRLTPYNGVRDCNAAQNGRCDVLVSVKVDGTKCQFDVQPPTLRIPRQGPVVIFWNLKAPSGWDFTENGIEFSKKKNTQLHDGMRLPRQQFRWMNKATAEDYFPYTIHIASTTGGRCDHDPGVWNDWDAP